MVWSRPAAPSHDSRSRRNELARITRHVLWRAEIDVPALHGTRNTRIRLGGQGKGSESSYALDGVEHGHWTHAAVTADYVCTPILETRCESCRVGTIQAVAIFVDRNLHDQGQFCSHILGCEHRLMEFLEISEGLQHQQIDAPFRECFDLLAEGSASFFKRSFSQGLDSCSQWANRSRDPHIETLGGLTGEPRTHPIHVRHFVG